MHKSQAELIENREKQIDETHGILLKRISKQTEALHRMKSRLDQVVQIMNFSEDEYQTSVEKNNVFDGDMSMLPTVATIKFLESLYGDELKKITNMTLHDAMRKNIIVDEIILDVGDSVAVSIEKQRLRTIRLFKTKLRTRIFEIGTKLESKLLILKDLKTSDSISTETAIVYAGVNGSLWYDEPLTTYIRYNRIRGTAMIKTHIRELVNATHIENVTLRDEYHRRSTISKIDLIGLLQQLLVITNSLDIIGHTTNKFMVKKREDSVNRGVFKIHHDYQISPSRVSELLEELDLLNCRVTCIMSRSSGWMNENEKQPKWLQNFLSSPESCKVSTWSD